MKILLDECLPRRLANLLIGHEVRTVRQMSWLGLSNGKLIAAANPEFDALLTVDTNLVHQQKLDCVHLAVIVFHARSNKIEDLAPLVRDLLPELSSVEPGQVIHVGV